jgi:HAD superfamily hydrolase (TIGR01509 family)
MAEQVYKSQCSLMTEVKMVLDFLKQSDIRLAIASSSFHSWIKMVLERFTLVKYFPVIVSAEDVGLRGKPAPDIYVYTVKKLNLQPKDCLVVEDSTNGVLSAKAAGTWVVGYRTPFNQSQDLREADISVKNLKDLIRYGPFSNNEKILGAFAQDFERRENGGVAVV